MHLEIRSRIISLALDNYVSIMYNNDNKGGIIMSYTLSEKKVLKKLDISDFRHMTKDKIVQFASMLPNMDPEVAKKALEQFPEFKDLAIEVVHTLQQSVETAMKSNDDSQNAFYEACNRVIDDLNNHLSSSNLTPEQEQSIRSDIIRVLEMMSEKDSENKAHLLMTVRSFCVSAVVITLAAVSLLGGNSSSLGELLDKHNNNH